MFYTLNFRSVRWWIVGVLVGLAGWAIWASLERSQSPRVPLAFERNFWPQPVSAPGPTPLKQAGGGTAVERGQAVASDEAAASEEAISAVAAEGPAAPGAPPAASGGLEPDSFRAQRERLRSQEMELARQVLDDPAASDERKAQAQQELVELLRRSRRELEIEELLKAAGLSDAVVSIGEGGVQVVVPQPLSAQGAARIGELVARMAGVRREHISIIDSLTAFGAPAAWEESPHPR